MPTVSMNTTSWRVARKASGSSIAGAIINGIIWMVLLIIFATIGGLIGVAIFEKRKGAAGVPPPPPPPAGGFGGPGPGGPASGGYGQGM